MIIKLLTLAMLMLLVGCGGSTGDGDKAGSSSNGSSGSSNGAKSDSAELIKLRKAVEDDYNIVILLNISVDGHSQYVEYLKDKMFIKTNQSFTSSDINCKSFNFTKISEGTNDKVKEATYKSKVESQDNKCMENNFDNEPEVKGDKNYIIIGKEK